MTRAETIIDTSSIENGLKQTITPGDAEYNTQIETEALAYAQHIHSLLPPKLPFSPDKIIFEQIKDGIVLGFVLDSIKPGCIDLSRLVQTHGVLDKKYLYEATSNLGLVLNAAKRLGIKLVNIGPEDILYENKILVLGLLWQIVRLSVSKSSSLLKRPELINLINECETIEDLCSKTPEELCLRWVNFHVENAKMGELIDKIQVIIQENDSENKSAENTIKEVHNVFKKCYNTSSSAIDRFVENSLNDDYWKIPEKCTNFSGDMKNSRIYLLLFKQLIPKLVSDEELLEVWFEKDLFRRAENVIRMGERIGCDKFISVNSIVTGDHRLNFLFCQTIMNKFPGMEDQVIDVDTLKERLCAYESNIISIKDNLEAISMEMLEKENLRKQKERQGVEMYRNMENKSSEYENLIEDMRVSYDFFARRVNKYVEESLNITLPNEQCENKESIWATIMRLLSEIKVLKSERDSALIALSSQKEINQLIDNKINEMAEIHKNEREKWEKMAKKKRTIFEFCGCGE